MSKQLKPNDFWQTPEYILDAINMMWPNGWFDPCPINPSFDGLKIDISYQRGIPKYFNPPFSQYLDWVKYWEGDNSEQIWIMDHDHSTQRMQQLLIESLPLYSPPKWFSYCLLYERVAFIDPETGKPKKGQMRCQTLIYKGSNSNGFAKNFKHLGLILNAWEDV